MPLRFSDWFGQSNVIVVTLEAHFRSCIDQAISTSDSFTNYCVFPHGPGPLLDDTRQTEVDRVQMSV